MIYVVKYNGLFQHRDESWFPDIEMARDHINQIAVSLRDETIYDKLMIEERHGLKYATGNGFKMASL